MILLQLAILIFSIVAHEVAHGYVAFRNGDDTAYHLGRLTLNPVSHIDLVGSILVPVFCYVSGMPIFGWAKPVPVNPVRLNSPRRDMGKVSLAGPFTNFSLAVFCFLVLRITAFVRPAAAVTSFAEVLQYGALINLMLGVFNLLPVLPLDGGRVLYSLLPFRLGDKYARTERYGMLVVIAFIFLGGARHLMWPLVEFLQNILFFIFFGAWS